MHDLLIGLLFLAMVVCPSIVAAIPRNDAEDEAQEHPGSDQAATGVI